MPYDPSFWVPSSPSRGAWSSSSPALPMQNFRYMYLAAVVVRIQPDRFGTVPFDDHRATSAQVGRAAVGGAPELGDRDGLSPSDEGTDAVAVPVGDLLRSISIE